MWCLELLLLGAVFTNNLKISLKTCPIPTQFNFNLLLRNIGNFKPQVLGTTGQANIGHRFWPSILSYY